MLYPTLNQPIVFVYIFLAGLASGLLFDLANFLLVFFNQNKVVKQVFYFISTIFSAFLLFFINLLTNFGQFRIFIVLAFLVAFTIERFTIGALITKAIQKTLKLKLKIKLPKLRKNKKSASLQADNAKN